jgi:hypothetical protein
VGGGGGRGCARSDIAGLNIVCAHQLHNYSLAVCKFAKGAVVTVCNITFNIRIVHSVTNDGLLKSIHVAVLK